MCSHFFCNWSTQRNPPTYYMTISHKVLNPFISTALSSIRFNSKLINTVNKCYQNLDENPVQHICKISE